MPGAAGAMQALLQQGNDFAIGATPLTGILVEQHFVESGAKDAGLLADVFITAIARALMTLYDTLDARDLSAGSPQARRLFS